MPPTPPDPQFDPDAFLRTQVTPGALPPPAARPTSAELIKDLHARQKWLASVKGSYGLVLDYMRYNWHDDEARSWAGAQIEPRAALAWRELRLRPAEAAELEKLGQRPEEVRAVWSRTGIPVAEIADWIGAGLTPEEAVDQRARGVTAEDAAVMRSLRGLDRR